MNRIEDRLQSAAQETRRLASARHPAPFVEKRSARRGWLVLATAFAAVALTFGLIPWLASNAPDNTVADTSPPTLASTPTTVGTTVASEPDASCSSAEAPMPAAMQELPEPVAETRDAIIAAAADCDIAALEDLAGDGFTSSFGGGGAANLSVWNDKGQDPTTTLLHLLDMTYATIEVEDGPDLFVWPAAYAYESWEQVTESDLDELARIHGEGELDLFATANAYLGWRTGIDEEGNWVYFVAGD